MHDEMITVAQAAEILGRSASRVAHMCEEGRFKTAVRITYRWFISRAEVVAEKERRDGKTECDS